MTMIEELVPKSDLELTTEQVLLNQLNHVISLNSILSARLDNANYTIALDEHKLKEYERKISEFNSFPWYKKLTYKF